MARRQKLLIEPSAAAVGDIAFNLIVFFLVCISTEPDQGRLQEIPRSESQPQEQQAKNIEVLLGIETVSINGSVVPNAQFVGQLKTELAGKASESDRVVVVKSSSQTPYEFWIDMTRLIEEAGGIVTLELEESETVVIE